MNVTIFDVFHANWVWNSTEIAQTSGEWLILCVQFDLLYKSMHLMVMKNKNWLGFLLCLQSLICQKMSYNITAKQNKNQNKHTSNWSWSLGIFCLSAMRKTLSSLTIYDYLNWLIFKKKLNYIYVQFLNLIFLVFQK